jgi:hypothetical protein
MYPRSVRAIQSDALFVSALLRGDELNTSEIQRTVMVGLDTYGEAGCAERVAQEFGDHPETAAVRMRWARASMAILEGQSVPGMRMSAADSSAPGGYAATKLPAIRSA